MTKSSLNYDDFELINITDKQLVDFTRLQNAVAWKGHLSANEYAVREVVLGKSKITLSKQNRLYVYMLRDIHNPDRNISSCELLVRKSWKFVWNELEKKVDKHEVLSGCVGGVFTYPESRGKGFAKIMIDKLVELSKKTFVGPDGFTFLYSEVGDYYERNGFHYVGVKLVNIPLKLNSKGGFAEAVDKFDGVVEQVTYHDFEGLFEEYRNHVEKTMEESVLNDHKTRISIIPTSDYVDWFHIRSKYLAAKHFYAPKIDFENSEYEELVSYFQKIEPNVYGLKISNGSGDNVGFIVWTYDYTKLEENYTSSITILKIFIKPEFENKYSKADLIKLMKAYVEDINQPMNKYFSPTKITLWESEVTKDDIESLIQDYDAKAGLENGSVSAVLMNDEAENIELMNNNIVWEGNDKLPWF